MSLWERYRPRGHKLCGKCGNLVCPKKIVECSEMGLDESFTTNYLTFLCTLGPTKFHNSAVMKRTAPEALYTLAYHTTMQLHEVEMASLPSHPVLS